MNNINIHDFIKKIPKAELHLHIEGTFEPELMFEIAHRNNIPIKYSSVEEVRKAYQFHNLQDFLNIYYAGAGVLTKEIDFYDLTMAYLRKAKAENIVHTEIFFDPQTHTQRGVTFQTVITCIRKALCDGEKQFGITSCLILCFLRHLDENEALKTLQQAVPFKEYITAVGLDSSEVGNPPAKFVNVFAKAHELGFLTVAHAGEEGDATYVQEAIDLLKIKRIDHGNSSLNDMELTKEIVLKQIPLTVCPLSNLKLKVVKNPKQHPLKKMLELGMKATVNSDDPAYFGGYLNENLIVMADALSLTKRDVSQLAENSFSASFLSEKEKQAWIEKVKLFHKENN